MYIRLDGLLWPSIRKSRKAVVSSFYPTPSARQSTLSRHATLCRHALYTHGSEIEQCTKSTEHGHQTGRSINSSHYVKIARMLRGSGKLLSSITFTDLVPSSTAVSSVAGFELLCTYNHIKSTVIVPGKNTLSVKELDWIGSRSSLLPVSNPV